jgi:hypothetical protein
VALMREAIELGPDLANLRDDEFFIGAAVIRLWVWECPLDVDVEAPRAEQGHLVVEDVSQFNDLAGFNELDGLHY